MSLEKVKPMYYSVRLAVRQKSTAKRLFFITIVISLIYYQYGCDISDLFPSDNTIHSSKLTIYRYNERPSSKDNIIVIMVSHLTRKLVEKLKYFDEHFNDQYLTSILILYDSTLNSKLIDELIHQCQRQILFSNIETIFKLFPSDFDPCRTKPTYRSRGKWNYHQMIRFWFKILFEFDDLKSYRYVMRLDDDSQIFGQWFNVFNEMKRNNAVYFANQMDFDEEKQLPGTLKLENLTWHYLETNHIEPKQRNTLKYAFRQNGIRTYFNNFEIVQLEFFQQSQIRHWIETIDQSHGIFLYRWGDAILRYLTLAIFAEETQILHRTHYNLSYCHKC